MKIEVEHIGNIALMVLLGELDSRGNQALDKSVRDLIAHKCYRLILDLSAIRFVGSQTLSLLISHLKELRAGGGNIKFLNPQRTVVQYLKQNRMIELFEVYSSKAEAVKAYELPQTMAAKPIASQADLTPVIDIAAAKEPTVNKSQFETGEILYANSCMIAALIRMLQTKGILTADEVNELMDYERLSMKGTVE